jgi:21S rRNA (GM2251-2'-O)-methyltransferase
VERVVILLGGGPSWVESGKRLEKGTVAETGYLSWEESKKRLEKVVRVVKDKLSGCGYNEREDSVEGGEAEEELEVVGDPRWDMG